MSNKSSDQNSLSSDSSSKTSKLYWKVLWVMLSVLLVSLVVVSIFTLYPLYEKSKRNLDFSYEKSLMQYDSIIAHSFSRLNDISTQISTRTRASNLLETLNSNSLDPSKVKELKKILTSAFKASPEIIGIVRYNMLQLPVAAVGSPVHSNSSTIDARHSYMVTEKGSKVYVTVVPVYGQSQNKHQIGYDVVSYNLKPILKELTKLENSIQHPFMWIGKVDSRLGVIAMSSSMPDLKEILKIIPNVDDSNVISSYNIGSVKYFIDFNKKYNMAVVSWVSQNQLAGEVLSEIYYIPIVIVVFIIVAVLILAFLLKPLLKGIVLHANQLESIVEEKTRDLNILNKELEMFSYSVSHDLRAPLRHITGFIEKIEGDADNHLSKEGIRQFGIVHGAAIRMSKLIEALLHYSRTGRNELKKLDFPLTTLVNEVVDELSHMREGRDISIEYQGLPTIFADRELVRLVIMNLLTNAIKFTAECEHSQITITSEENTKCHMIHVSDNGVGFNPEYAETIFGVFKRLHDRDVYEGTGIGLANVARIVQRHGGKVSATSNPGIKTTISFTIPKKLLRSSDDR